MLSISIHFNAGYKKIVISSKKTASSFSFGQKHKHIARYESDGPGPSAYDITGLSIKGIANNKTNTVSIIFAITKFNKSIDYKKFFFA